MYRSHESREDTVLFPALRSIVSKNEYLTIGEKFKKREAEIFGKDGFEAELAKVEKVEKQLGIYDMAKLTPAMPM
jgi:hemerythrin-like domain-containing protein